MDTRLPSARDDDAPRDADAVRPVAIGTLLWLVAMLGLTLAAERIGLADPERWIATAVVGAALGVLGIAITRRRSTPNTSSGSGEARGGRGGRGAGVDEPDVAAGPRGVSGSDEAPGGHGNEGTNP